MDPCEPSGTGAAPLGEGARIRRIDALRGVALLGVLVANVRQLMLPFDIGNFPTPLGTPDPIAWIDWWVFDALIDSKFITIFSLLFGVSFALQTERLESRGVACRAIMLRRFLVLGLLGVAHGLLLYPAEVLLPYAMAGVLLFAVRRLSGVRLAQLGLWLVGLSLFWGFEIGSLGHVSVVLTVLCGLLLVIPIALLPGRPTTALLGWTLVIALATGAILLSGTGARAPSVAIEYADAVEGLAAMQSDGASVWPEEFRVRQSGSLASLIELHVQQYALLLLFTALLLLWKTWGLFAIGAAAYRYGLLADESSDRWRIIAVAGLGIGLPLSVGATWLQSRELLGLTDLRWPALLHAFSALPLAAGLSAGVFVLHRAGRARSAWAWLEAPGRMALTNYVGQSLVMATLAEPWGFGRYGHLGGAWLTAVGLVVFAILAAASRAWLERYRLGPLEWLWRCATYRRWLPNLRKSAAQLPSLPS